jgi:hypothetical protein
MLPFRVSVASAARAFSWHTYGLDQGTLRKPLSYNRITGCQVRTQHHILLSVIAIDQVGMTIKQDRRLPRGVEGMPVDDLVPQSGWQNDVIKLATPCPRTFSNVLIWRPGQLCLSHVQTHQLATNSHPALL